MTNVLAGQTDYSVFVFIPDPASTDGSGKTGLVAANLTVSGSRMEADNDATVIDYTSSLNNLAALTTAHTDWGLLEVSATLAPGLYRLDIADAIFASGAWAAVVYVMITTSAAAASPMKFDIVDTTVASSPLGAIKAKTDLQPGTQDGKTFAQTINLMSAVILGKLSGVDTGTMVFRDMADAANRVTVTVDATGRLTATYNPA